MITGQRTWRIAVGGVSQESNSFVRTRTDLQLFRNSYLLEGSEIWRLDETDAEIAGILATCRHEHAKVVPLVATRSVSGGPLTADCYATLKQMLLASLQTNGPVDGVILALHGAMLADGEDDPEGDILANVRAIVGADAPIVATLDLHAHVTERMIQNATALVSYAHYPHDDAFTTGERAARLLFQAVEGCIRPVAVLAKAPIVVSACNGQTFGDAPLAHLTERARQLETLPGVLSVSCFQVHPNLDLPGLGCGALVTTDGDLELAEEIARSLAEEFWARRWEFVPETLSVGDAVARGRAAVGGPVLLIDAADCCGGGAAGDSVAVLGALMTLDMREPTYVMVVDPRAAQSCAQAGINQTVTLDVGHQLDEAWGQPIKITGRVRLLSDGDFLYEGGPFGGTRGAMGLSAVLEVSGIRVLIMSRPTYDWAHEQFRSMGMDPRAAKFISVKNPMNYRFAYRDVAVGRFILDTTGPTPARIQNLSFRRLDHPTFPFEDSVLPPRIDVVHGGSSV